MPTTRKQPKTEKPRLFTAGIYVSKKLVSSVTLKAANEAAATFAIHKMIKVKINGKR
jgi:hypothetical protein